MTQQPGSFTVVDPRSVGCHMGVTCQPDLRQGEHLILLALRIRILAGEFTVESVVPMDLEDVGWMALFAYCDSQVGAPSADRRPTPVSVRLMDGGRIQVTITEWVDEQRARRCRGSPPRRVPEVQGRLRVVTPND